MRTDLIALGALLLSGGSLHAQAAPDTTMVYEREVFEYGRGGRPDPFRSLLKSADLGVRVGDLVLLGVVHHPDPTRSVAVIAQTGASRRIRARVGDRIGTMRVLAIRPTSVDVLVEELGVARRETLALRQASNKGGSK